MRDRQGECSARHELVVSLHRIRDRQERRRSPAICRHLAWIAALALLGAGFSVPSFAEDASAKQMQGLDEQVQVIKSDALRIAAELDLLEERLLYPSDTQVAVFVSLGEGESFRLDSVQVHLDGAPVAHHIYSFKELEALRKGGVQRIYTGNLATGTHQLDVSIAGKLPGGGDLAGSESFTFDKKVGPKLVGMTLGGSRSGAAEIRLGGW